MNKVQLAVPEDQLLMGDGTEEEVKLSPLKNNHVRRNCIRERGRNTESGSEFDNSTQISNASRPKTTSI